MYLCSRRHQMFKCSVFKCSIKSVFWLFICRGVERELFPCLRRFGIAFYAYNSVSKGAAIS